MINPYRVSQRMPTCPICKEEMPYREPKEQHGPCGMDCASWAIDHRQSIKDVPSNIKVNSPINNDI